MQSVISISRLMFVIILLLSCLDSIAAYVYLPALPAITKEFEVNSSVIQLTLSIFMLASGLSRLVYGPLSDRFGRRAPIFAGIGFSICGTIMCYFAPSVLILAIGRGLQGVGVSASHTISLSIARDLLSSNRLAKFLSKIGMLLAFVAGGAVALGGIIQHFFGWRAIFLGLTIYSLCILLLTIIWLPETNQDLNPEAIKFKVLFRNYFLILKNRTFLGFTLCAGFADAGLSAYNVSAPYILQNIVGLTPAQYGALGLVITLAIFISAIINNKYILGKGIYRMSWFGLCLMIMSGSLMLFLGLLGYINTFVIMFPVGLYTIGLGFVLINTTAGAFEPFSSKAGAVSALYGSLLVLFTSLGSTIPSVLSLNNQISLASIFICLSLLSFISLKFIVGNYSIED